MARCSDITAGLIDASKITVVALSPEAYASMGVIDISYIDPAYERYFDYFIERAEGE